MYKLIALDMDGTTLNMHHVIHPRTKEAIQRAMERGVKVTLISGREPASMVGFAGELGLKGMISCMNGCIVCSADGETIHYDHWMKPEDVAEVIRLCHENRVTPAVFSFNDIYVKTKEDPFSKLIDDYVSHPALEVGELIPYLERTGLISKVNKIGVSEEHEVLVPFRDRVLEHFGDKMNCLFSLPFNVEIFGAGVNKGSALAYIAEQYGIRREETIAVGDGENDIGMLQFAGLGIAMGNAMDTLKVHADYIADTNTHHGVAQVIEKFLLT